MSPDEIRAAMKAGWDRARAMEAEEVLSAFDALDKNVHFPIDVHALEPLVAEVRRLRRDGWMEAAVLEWHRGGRIGDLIAILRKYRDGKA